jgi:protein-disulfide isomerase
MSKQATLQHRREARLAAEHAEKSREQRLRRLKLLAAAATAAAVLVVGGALISSAGGKKSATPSSPAHSSDLFAGLKETDGVIGDKSAPLTVTEYLDLQCPICAETSRTVIPTVVNDYVRSGKVKLQARTLHFIGSDSVRAAQVAAGAAQQDKLWPFVEAFYAKQGAENSGYVTDAFLRDIAKTAGVDAGKALEYADTAAAQKPLATANADAAALKIDGTPTFTVQRGDGPVKVVSADQLTAELAQR